MDCTSDVNERNILRILVNNDDGIMIEDQIVPLENLKDITKAFLDNNGDGNCKYCNGFKSSSLSDNPKVAVVSLQNGKQTTYKTYVAVQNELTKAYFELRRDYSMKTFGKPADKLSKTELQQVKDAYPFILSEAETK
jgi:hypothetical protein